MKRGYKGILVGVFLITGFLFSLSLVAAATTGSQGIIKTLWDAFFGGIFEGAGSIFKAAIVARVLLVLLVTMLVYSVSDFIPVVGEKDGIKWAVSLIVGILGFLLVDDATITGILTTYTALGIALTSVLPLIILMAFHYRIATNPNFRKASPVFTLFISKFLFLIFGIWLVLKWSETNALGTAYAQAYLGAAFVAFIWIFIGNWLMRKLSKKASKAGFQAGVDDQVSDQMGKILVRIDDLQNEMRLAPAGRRAVIKAKITELKKVAEDLANQ